MFPYSNALILKACVYLTSANRLSWKMPAKKGGARNAKKSSLDDRPLATRIKEGLKTSIVGSFTVVITLLVVVILVYLGMVFWEFMSEEPIV